MLFKDTGSGKKKEKKEATVFIKGTTIITVHAIPCAKIYLNAEVVSADLKK